MSRAQRVLRDLAVLSGVERAVRDMARRARAEADAMLMEANDALGSKSAELRLFGEKVGSLSVAVSNPMVYVADEEAYQDWLRERYVLGDSRVQPFYEAPLVVKSAVPRADGEGGYVVYDAETGEPVDGLSYHPGGEVKGTRLSGCKPDDVARALRRENMDLGDGIALAMEPDAVALPAPEAGEVR